MTLAINRQETSLNNESSINSSTINNSSITHTPINQNLLLNKAFFGKNNCLKITLNMSKDCYFHFGVLKNEKNWGWKKVKFNDMELGEIINVLENKKPSVSFFHKFNGGQTQIWINKSEKYFFIKVKELSKSLNEGEQTVLKVLLERIIWIMNT